MTITSNETRNEYTATAGQTVFTYTFKIFASTDINAYVTPAGQDADDSTDEVAISLVTGVGDEAGGTVTIPATTAGDKVTLVSDIVEERQTDYQNNGDFRPDTVNEDFDRVVSISKQTSDFANRGLTFQKSEQDVSGLTLQAPQANYLLQWNDTATGTTNYPVTATAETNHVSSIAALRLIDISGYANGDTIDVLGYYLNGDSGGGRFFWDSTSTETDNNGTIIQVTGVATGRFKRPETYIITPYMFGALGDGTTDDTTALINSYTYAKSLDIWKRPALYLGSGEFKTTGGLAWDGSIPVYGNGPEKTVIMKSGSYNTITIEGDQCDISDFTVSTTTGAIIGGDTGNGLWVSSHNLSSLRNVHVLYQGGNGVVLKTATSSRFSRIVTRYNGATGFLIDSTGGAQNCNANEYSHIDSLGNGDHGVWIKNSDNDYSVGHAIICQQNGKHGFFLEALSGIYSVYGEVNDQDGTQTGSGTYRDIYLSSNSVRNQISVIFATSDNALFDDGTNNILINVGTTSVINLRNLGPRPRDTNAVGRGITVFGGTAGAGATGYNGGNLSLESGSAAGTTGDGNGGDIILNSGVPVNSGRYGYISIDANDNTTSLVGGATASTAGASLELKSTSKAFLVNKLTTTQRDAVTSPTGGMIIYNTTLSKFQGFEAGVWTNLI